MLIKISKHHLERISTGKIICCENTLIKLQKPV